MKKLSVLFAALFIGIVAAHAISVDWYVDGSVYDTTTCTAGDNITPPTAPTKRGYTFMGWMAYTPIEYLESTGTQYIDTGFSPNIYTRVDYKVQLLDMNNGGQLISARVGSDASSRFIVFGTYNAQLARTVFGNSENTFNCSSSLIITGSFRPQEGVYILNTSEYTFRTPTNFTKNASNNLYLFAASGYGQVSYLAIGRIYFVQIYYNGTLVRDMIPVLDPNGVACMYDKVTETFFYNAGTGNFVAGPVISE